MLIEQWKINGGTVIVEKRNYVAGRVLLEQWNSVGGTVWWNSVGGRAWWNSGTVMEEQCGGTVEQCWWNTHSGAVRQRWWNSGIVMVEQ